MAVVYNMDVKNARLQAVVDALGPNGQLVIGTDSLSGGVGILVRIPLANPAATVAGGVLTLAGVPLSDDAISTGIAELAELRDGADTTVVSGLTVGTAATDLIINAVEISTGQLVQVTAGLITHG